MPRPELAGKVLLDSGRLEYALRTSLKPENKEKLVNYAKGFDNTR